MGGKFQPPIATQKKTEKSEKYQTALKSPLLGGDHDV
jgi:hypothetical protein